MLNTRIQSYILIVICFAVLIPSLVKCYRVLDEEETNSEEPEDLTITEGKKLNTALKIVKAYLEYQLDEVDSMIKKEGFILCSISISLLI